MRFSIQLALIAGSLVAASPLCPQVVTKATGSCQPPDPTGSLDYEITLQAYYSKDGPGSKTVPVGFPNESYVMLMSGYESTWTLEEGRLKLVADLDTPRYLGRCIIPIYPPRLGAVPDYGALTFEVTYACLDDKVHASLRILDVHPTEKLALSSLEKDNPLFLVPTIPDISIELVPVRKSSKRKSTSHNNHLEMV